MPSDYKHRYYSDFWGNYFSAANSAPKHPTSRMCHEEQHGVQGTLFTRGCEYTVDLLLFVMMGIWACGAFKSVNQHCL